MSRRFIFLGCFGILFFNFFYLNILSANTLSIENSNPLINLSCDDVVTVVQFDLEACTADAGIGNINYDDFQPSYPESTGCSVFTASNIYRDNPSANPHSCTIGYDEQVAMCVSPQDTCNYDAGNEHSIKFDVTVTPGSTGVAILSGLSFYESAPLLFSWIDGSSGLNDYPRYYGMRVLIGDTEVYREDQLTTSSNWTLETFDFTGDADFVVFSPTVFSFELLAYCPQDQGSIISAWDIDDVKITSCCVDCNDVVGGTLTSNGPQFICSGDGVADEITFEVAGNAGINTQFVELNNNGDIISISADGVFDFEGAPSGNCEIFAITYHEELGGLEVGLNVRDLRGCHSFSNGINITKNFIAPGVISTVNGTLIQICAGDGIDDVIDVSLTGNEGDSYWLVTNSSGEILDLPSGPSFNFESAISSFTCQLWHMSGSGVISGLTIGENVSDLQGCYLFSNPILVVKSYVNGGILSSDDTDLCRIDGSSRTVSVRLSAKAGQRSQWVVTDANGDIAALPNTTPINMDGLPLGTYSIWHLSYTGDIDGVEIGASASGLSGCLDLSNPVSVTITEVNGGVLSTTDPVDICVGDGLPNTIDVSVSGNIGTNGNYLITDQQGVILNIPQGFPIDFEPLPNGVCLIWFISYENDLTGLEIGVTPDALSGCFDLSNPITVTRNESRAGNISTNDPTSFCVGDGISDIVSVTSVGTISPLSSWMITDANGTILSLPIGSTFDFDDQTSGTCFIYLVAYQDGLSGLQVGNNLASLSGCFSLSNSIEINRDAVDGGTISTDDNTSVCAGDGNSDNIDITLTGAVGPNSIWVLSDNAGTIIDLVNDPDMDYESSAFGTCIWRHLSYTSTVSGVDIGANINNISGCFDFSNVLQINKEVVIGGEISTSAATSVCVGDDDVTVIDVNLSGNEGDVSQWIVTDAAGQILDLNLSPPFSLEDFLIPECQIWHLSYQVGLVGLAEGENAADLSGCFSLSNPITINKEVIEGGIISTSSNLDVCLGDGAEDLLEFNLVNNVGPNSQFLLVDDLGNIEDVIPTGVFDIELRGNGACNVYHISSSDLTTGINVGQNIADIDGCYDLSNAIQITKSEVSGGNIATTDNTDICTGDGVSDIIDVAINQIQGENFAWVITDENGIILELPAGPPFDFEGAGGGICLIWHLSFQDGLLGANIGSNANDLVGCYALSNPITVTRTPVNGGSISTPDPTTVCSGDGQNDFVDVVLIGNEGDNSFWVITDPSGNILEIPTAPPFNFEGAGGGVCQIWHLSTNMGTTGISTGNNVSEINGCFNFSNPITINRNEVEGGTISTSDPTTICSGDGQADLINVALSGEVGNNFAWVITDDAGNILDLPSSPPFDLDGAGAGTCLIWHLSYNGTLSGAEIGNNANQLDGCFDLSDPIIVTRTGVDGGRISTNSLTTTCTGDGNDDLIDATVIGAVGSNSQWVITDESLNILDLPSAAPFNFEGTPGGVCLIWHLSFDGAISGAEVGANANDLEGCYDLSNSIRVVREEISGGVISTNDPTDICTGDGNDDIVNVNVDGAVGEDFAWVVTDASGNILEISSSSIFNFEGAGAGTCLIWYLSYNGNINGANVGNNANDIEGCYSLSDPIIITRNEISGGTISTNDNTDICTGDGNADFINVSVDGNVGSNTAWVITDANGNILDLPMAPPFNFEGAGVGVCLIWHLSFEDLAGAEIGNNASDLTGCFALSNPITVNRTEIAGGTIQTLDDTNVCVGDGSPDPIAVSVTGNIGTNSAWVITDLSANILDLPAGPPFDFDGAGAGSCVIWHLSYEAGTTGLTVGANANDIEGCYSLSNAITVIRTAVDGGEITTNDPTTVCVGNDIESLINVQLSGNIGAESAWIITDDMGNIIDLPAAPPFDFENAPAGVCYIYNISYEFGLTGLNAGTNVADITGCYDLSDPIVVTRIPVDGGTIFTADPTVLCLGDDEEDIIDVSLSGNVGALFTWVITDIDGKIIDVSDGPPFDFAGTGSGTCFIWHLSYENNLSNLQNGNNISDLEGCFSFSNSIEVTKSNVDGGVISTDDNTIICSGDGVPDVINVDLAQNAGEDDSWVITDTDGNILDLADNPPFDFEGAGSGVCFIWHISYESGITGLEINNNVANLSGCYDLSNSIEVIREGAGAGEISIDGLDVITICTGDCVADAYTAELTGNFGPNGYWIITDDLGNVIDLPATPDFDFEGAPPGTCYIYFLSYDMTNPGLGLGDNINDLDGCINLSNAVTVIRNAFEGVGTSKLNFDFDGCDAAQETAENRNYGEFDPIIENISNCAQWEIIGFNIYRNDPTTNQHSCTDGNNNTPALCIDGLDACAFEADNDKALRFDVRLTPGVSGVATFDNISFFERGPEMYNWLNGGMGVNDYPIYYGMRVSVNGSEIFRQEDIPTSRVYDFEEFDFSGNGAFTIEEPTVFNFEILPYCPVGNGGEQMIWDIEDIMISSECNNKFTTDSLFFENGLKTVIDCVDDGVDNILAINEFTLANPYIYIITDEDDVILDFYTANNINFEGSGEGIVRIWGLVYSGNLSLQIGDDITDITTTNGCLLLTPNFLTVRKLTGQDCPGSIAGEGNPVEYIVKPNPANDYIIVSLKSLPSKNRSIKIYDILGNLIDTRSYSDAEMEDVMIDISKYQVGHYMIKVISDNNQKVQKFSKME